MLAPKSHKNRSRRLSRRAWEPESAQTPPDRDLDFDRFLGDMFMDVGGLLVDCCSMIACLWINFVHRFLIVVHAQFCYFSYFLRKRGGGYADLLRFEKKNSFSLVKFKIVDIFQ